MSLREQVAEEIADALGGLPHRECYEVAADAAIKAVREYDAKHKADDGGEGEGRDEQELKPCPFCGGRAITTSWKDCDGDWWIALVCGKCGVGIKAMDMSKSEAYAKWNTRAVITDGGEG